MSYTKEPQILIHCGKTCKINDSKGASQFGNDMDYQ